MWLKFRTWSRRFIGLVINSIIFILPLAVLMFDWAGTNVDWNELLGEQKGALAVTLVAGTNIALRWFVTRTQGHPSDPLGT